MHPATKVSIWAKPIFRRAIRGLIVGVRVQLLDTLLKICPGFAINVAKIISLAVIGKPGRQRLGQDAGSCLRPTRARVDARAGPRSLRLPVVLLAGLLTVMLLTALVHFVQTTRRHAAQVTTINQALQYEIAERERAEAALRVSYQFLQSTLDALPAHIAILDASGTIVAVNMDWRHFDDNDFAGPDTASANIRCL
jgi:PAS domain-containing protein